ncbi:acyl-CoA dehydrogenase [Streptomyces sp. NBC_01089]|uniref:acyl-CoA dehydrogenase n=1 Tax=Streptomyces sp. NBC_01089 TaxID=2903747 RepID=UPI00386546C1|nr:acyl-CoA dehydrogenase [Streptomyces sp. NBC_01089]
MTADSATAPRPPGPDDRARAISARLLALIEKGALQLPPPGGGRTADRFRALAELGREDLTLARLAEGHVDAIAILDEIEGSRPDEGERWGVWAAQPPGPGLTATPSGGGWRLDGVKPYCSGAHTCTRALVTADSPEGRRLFAVAVSDDGVAPVPGTWQAVGMDASDSPDVSFSHVPAIAVGGVDDYTNRPGFQHGGIGVAACWLGGARAVADTLVESTARRPLDAHAAAHLGAVDMLITSAETVVERAAADIDADPWDTSGCARVRSLRVRAFVEKVCTEVLHHIGRATGAAPLCHDPRHARAVADLTVYIRQHHAERNLAELGNLLSLHKGQQ